MGLDLRTIKSRVERLSCPTCGEHPIGVIRGSQLDFNCCCEKFRSTCLEHSKKVFEEETRNAFENMLKKSFKNLRIR